MTDKILEMVKKVGAKEMALGSIYSEYMDLVFTKAQIEAFANLIRADEREAINQSRINNIISDSDGIDDSMDIDFKG